MNQKTLGQLLECARHAIEVTDDELDEAKRRRRLLAGAMRRAFPGSTIYFNGSVAHGDANTPLTDVDLGAKLSSEDADGYGPGQSDALPLMERARQAIREDLSEEFKKLTVTVEGRRRAVLVRFGEPVTLGQPDFTADVMTAIPHSSGKGLYIPNMEISARWDRADPLTHTRLVLDALDKTDRVFARAVRLLKHWNKTHSKPLCSWNIKALALDCIDEPMPLIDALSTFFTHAYDALGDGPTPDPAGVAGPIPLNMPMAEARRRLRTARDDVALAKEHESEGRPLSAQHALSRVLPDIVPDVDATDEEQARLRLSAIGMTGFGPGLVAPSVTPTRAWAP
ncbi:nucleotidyltransferase [Streptomyces roseicoloratus]|uniref:nucleotidyltransferase n=1 Tax=Streptomyces roseicoloratus TaxID=2508722 RepID=UPI001009FCAB|nr:nucleotidyltransferase [Streptomyces roseicoloratus]